MTEETMSDIINELDDGYTEPTETEEEESSSYSEDGALKYFDY